MQLTIPSIESLKTLDSLNETPIDVINWSDYTYAPKTTFKIAKVHSKLCILFCVEETNPRAVNVEDFQPVWEDSCVEFFCQVPGEKRYYNFEFNSLGTCVASSRLGQNKGVEFLDKEKMASIKRTIKRDAERWSILVEIPLSIIFGDGGHSPLLKVNFYKCGDKCERPHFLSWSPICKPEPAFHCPEFFGEAVFEELSGDPAAQPPGTVNDWINIGATYSES